MVLVACGARRDAPPLNRLFRRLQLLSAAAYSLGHGTNDAQKTMGIIAALLFSAGYLGSEFYVPAWVILAAHAAIALGTLAGGWRIVKTMGMRITSCGRSAAVAPRPRPRSRSSAPSARVPVSTTHTISGAIIGVGTAAASVGGALGGGRADGLGLGPDDPGLCSSIAALMWWVLRLLSAG